MTAEHREVHDTTRSYAGYGIFNKNTNVMENSTTILPEAIQWCKTLEGMLASVYGPTESDSSASSIAWPVSGGSFAKN